MTMTKFDKFVINNRYEVYQAKKPEEVPLPPCENTQTQAFRIVRDLETLKLHRIEVILVDFRPYCSVQDYKCR